MMQNDEYLPNVSLKTFEKLDSIVPEILLTAL